MKCSRQLVALPKINVNDEHANVVRRNRKDIFTRVPTRMQIRLVKLTSFLWLELPMASCSLRCCSAAGKTDTQILLRTYGLEVSKLVHVEWWIPVEAFRSNNFWYGLSSARSMYGDVSDLHSIDSIYCLGCEQAWVTSVNFWYCGSSRDCAWLLFKHELEDLILLQKDSLKNHK